MTEADIHLCDRSNFGIMYGQLPLHTCRLMELHCLAGICSHATGSDLMLLHQTCKTLHLHEM